MDGPTLLSVLIETSRTWDVKAFNTPIFASQALLMKWQMRKARLASGQTAPVTLAQLMVMTMGHKATNPRDRVYGLYGMLPQYFEDQFAVSYSESLDDFWLRLSEYFLCNGSSVWMLVHSGGVEVDGTRPSWSIVSEVMTQLISFHRH